MTIAEPTIAAGTVEPPGGDDAERLSTGEQVVRALKLGFMGIVGLFVAWLLITEGKARVTVLVAAISIGVSAAIWIGANLIFNQVRDRWPLFNALSFGVVGFVVASIISGNRLISRGGDGFINFIWFPLLLAAAAGAAGFVLSTTHDQNLRYAIGVGGLGAVGVLTGALLDDSVRPEIDIVGLLAWGIPITAAGVLLALALRQSILSGALLGGALGWTVGAFGAPDLGDGSVGWAIVAAAVPFALVGLRIAMAGNPELTGRARIDTNSRSWIFLTPALLFIVFALVFPALRTLWLSFLDRDSEEVVWFGNYVDIWQDPTSRDFGDWSNMFFSWPMIIGLGLLGLFFVVGSQAKQRTGKMVELGSPSFGPLVIGGLFLCFAVFSALRGTIINNLWWVVVVTLFATALGLAVAVLADGVGYEKIAKSIIFMPMAISLVGASVIWRFMYVARDSSKEQTGVLNGLWVGLGRLSTGQGIASVVFVLGILLIGVAVIMSSLRQKKFVRALIGAGVTAALLAVFAPVWTSLSGNVQKAIVGLVFTAAFAGLSIVIAQAIARRDYGRAIAPGVLWVLLGWFLLRFWQIWGGGVGGQATNGNGDTVPSAINFIQEQPYNNVFLMVVLIWIQTGFAMVILSAAIKAVPDEIIEAARVDGATPPQIFWRVTLPQIAPTIGVVVTTIIVLVMKVYDIVKVMTNSNFGTQVLANDMFNQAFLIQNFGRGSALAMLIFVSVLPIMFYNIRRMQRES